MENNIAIKNRLLKNFKRLQSYVKQEKLQAYRLYDRDIPEYPYIVDFFGDYAIIYERGLKDELVPEATRTKHFEELVDSLQSDFKKSDDLIIFKKRERQKGKEQYEKHGVRNDFFEIKEGNFSFWINPYDYLDVGLFLDHRPLRKMLNKSSKGKKILNLFSYTGSISVACALGGGRVTSVDLSNTYSLWAMDNFRLNDIDPKLHTFVVQDVFQFLKNDKNFYDIIILDPPSFSNSKKIEGSFDVQRDHLALVQLCMNRLAQDGVLYFSNNHRKFKLADEIKDLYEVKDISQKTIPPDFRDEKIHKCFEIKKGA